MNQPLVLPLARAAIDRDYLTRTRDEVFVELFANADARVMPIYDSRVLLVGPADHPQPKLQLVDPAQVQNWQHLVYLGKTTDESDDLPIGSPIILAILDEDQASKLAHLDRWQHLRRTGAGLSDRDSGLFAQGLALANWHANHKFCPRCGATTTVKQAGWVRECSVDGHELFPRTDPAIIVSVIDDQDRILLGSQGVWEANRWSILAGFVEPGESLTAAVLREMHEEAGVHVIDPKYLGSQAWPFPYSLMVGFTAKIDPQHSEKDLLPDGFEIEKLRWFSRDDIAAEASKLLLPGRMTISRALIEHWYGSEIVSATELEKP